MKIFAQALLDSLKISISIMLLILQYEFLFARRIEIHWDFLMPSSVCLPPICKHIKNIPHERKIYQKRMQINSA